MVAKSAVSATHANWLDSFQAAYASPGNVKALKCPNCGRRALQLRFVTYSAGAIEGHGVVWCDACLTGLAGGPCTIPAGGVAVDHDEADIPRFHIVPPPSRPIVSSN